MHTNYNINQTTLCINTEYIPQKNNTAHYINGLVESLQLAEPYLFGRQRKYDLSILLKLVLFAYTREVVKSNSLLKRTYHHVGSPKNKFQMELILRWICWMKY